MENEEVKALIGDMTVVKVIAVPGKLVNIVVKCEAIYITIAECQLFKGSSRIGLDYNESKINLEYMSSLMLVDYLWSPSQEMRFSGINCEITETTELLGVYPYQIDYDELTFPRDECDIKGDVVSKMVGHGFSLILQIQS